jgi:mono/diheme cytochrome c family protein
MTPSRVRWGRRAVVVAALLLPVVGVLCYGWYKLFHKVPQEYVNDQWYFEHGSIGAEEQQGLPYFVWLVLPRVFPDYLPGQGGYASLGVIYRPGEELPIGFSRMVIGFPRVAFNCAVCHAATVRGRENENPTIYPAAPANRFDAQGYLKFLFDCAADPRFTADNILAEIAYVVDLPWEDQLLYRYVIIPQTRQALLKQRGIQGWMFDDNHKDAPWGRGRIDPFNPVKFGMLGMTPDATIGNSDMMSLWNLEARQGKSLHWDGLQGSIHETVLSSALGDGATPKSLPQEHLARQERWLRALPPPAYPFPIDAGLKEKGARVYAAGCARCHEPGGERTGTVIPLDEKELATDRHRLDMWTTEARDRYSRYADGRGGTFHEFRKTDGYQAVPLDGAWLRAPYLHNGSVPTLWDLVQVPAARPAVFYRGYDVYDPKKVGFVSEGEAARREGWCHDSARPGNSNGGHLYGTDLSADDKKALIEYLKSL